jgi:hypothetical protein
LVDFPACLTAHPAEAPWRTLERGCWAKALGANDTTARKPATSEAPRSAVAADAFRAKMQART